MSSTSFAGGDIKLIINGQAINSDFPPQIINGRTMVPIRVVSETLGGDVSWDGRTNTVTITSTSSTPSKQGIQNIELYQLISWAGNQLTTLQGLINLEYNDVHAYKSQEFQEQLATIDLRKVSRWQADIRKYGLPEEEMYKFLDMLEHTRRAHGFLESGMTVAAQEEWVSSKEYHDELFIKYDAMVSGQIKIWKK